MKRSACACIPWVCTIVPTFEHTCLGSLVTLASFNLHSPCTEFVFWRNLLEFEPVNTERSNNTSFPGWVEAWVTILELQSHSAPSLVANRTSPNCFFLAYLFLILWLIDPHAIAHCLPMCLLSRNCLLLTNVFVRWGASREIDLSHWSKFPGFLPTLRTQASLNNGKCPSLSGSGSVFLRLKEQVGID
jgi:hypothetical protein